jgi:uncharacterized protein
MTDEAIRVADFLKSNPDFLITNPGILAFVRLPEQHTGNVVFLQDRQLQTMREKLKALEHRIASMSNAAVENQAIVVKLLAISRSLLSATDDVQLPALLVEHIKAQFAVPIVRLALWTTDDTETQAERDTFNRIKTLYCGFAEQAPSLRVFEGENVCPRSLVLIPLRIGSNSETFGVLGLGSSDKDRFSPTLEIDFLNTLSEIACAALNRLQKTAS